MDFRFFHLKYPSREIFLYFNIVFIVWWGNGFYWLKPKPAFAFCVTVKALTITVKKIQCMLRPKLTLQFMLLKAFIKKKKKKDWGVSFQSGLMKYWNEQQHQMTAKGRTSRNKVNVALYPSWAWGEPAAEELLKKKWVKEIIQWI